MGNLLAREKKNQTRCLGLTFVRLLTASGTNNRKGKHFKLSLVIVAMLACFASKQPFTDFTSLFTLAISFERFTEKDLLSLM